MSAEQIPVSFEYGVPFTIKPDLNLIDKTKPVSNAIVVLPVPLLNNNSRVGDFCLYKDKAFIEEGEENDLPDMILDLAKRNRNLPLNGIITDGNLSIEITTGQPIPIDENLVIYDTPLGPIRTRLILRNGLLRPDDSEDGKFLPLIGVFNLYNISWQEARLLKVKMVIANQHEISTFEDYDEVAEEKSFQLNAHLPNEQEIFNRLSFVINQS